MTFIITGSRPYTPRASFALFVQVTFVLVSWWLLPLLVDPINAPLELWVSSSTALLSSVIVIDRAQFLIDSQLRLEPYLDTEPPRHVIE
jgi:hypothetical protein